MVFIHGDADGYSAMGSVKVWENMAAGKAVIAISEEGTASKDERIDMIIDRADRLINICEMKFSIDDFTIDKDCDASLRNKIAAVYEMSKGKRNPQMTLITTYGLKENQYCSHIQHLVTMNDLFCTK